MRVLHRHWWCQPKRMSNGVGFPFNVRCLRIKDSLMRYATSPLLRSKISLHYCAGCFRSCRKTTPHIGPGRWFMHSGIHEPGFLTNRMKIFGFWEGIGYSHILLRPMVTLSGGISRRSYSDYRSQIINTPYGPTGIILVIDKLDSTWPALVDPTED